MLKQLGMAAAALAMLAQPGLADSQQVMTGFRYAYAHPHCAPWDGAATRIVIQDVPYKVPGPDKLPVEHFPQYSVALWTGHPEVGRWIEVGPDFAKHGGGSISVCPAQGKCDWRSGRVRITKLTPDSMTGELRIDAPGHTGRDQVFTFTAPIIHLRMFCG
ncbi:MAG: hypothetical protein JWM80_107 [Cyanobacteria bacterium RYN_339]|nr:hypothetical protein [Cyanobacteria bacterium RYN_339]